MCVPSIYLHECVHSNQYRTKTTHRTSKIEIQLLCRYQLDSLWNTTPELLLTSLCIPIMGKPNAEIVCTLHESWWIFFSYQFYLPSNGISVLHFVTATAAQILHQMVLANLDFVVLQWIHQTFPVNDFIIVSTLSQRLHDWQIFQYWKKIFVESSFQYWMVCQPRRCSRNDKEIWNDGICVSLLLYLECTTKQGINIALIVIIG